MVRHLFISECLTILVSALAIKNNIRRCRSICCYKDSNSWI